MPGERAEKQVAGPSESPTSRLLRAAAAAARLLGTVQAAREAVGAPLPPVDQADYHRSVDALRTVLGEEAFAAAWAEGRAMDLQQAADDAMEGVLSLN